MAGGLALPPAPNQPKAPEDMSMEEFQEMLLDPDFEDLDDFDFGADAGQTLGNMPAGNVMPPLQMPRPQMPPMLPVPPTPTSSVMPTPPPMPPTMQPNVAMGPSWNPMIGWYYPVMPQNSMSMGPPPLMPCVPILQEGFTPAPSVGSLASADSSRASTPIVAGRPRAMPRGKRDRKRKYGPAAYLEEQIKQSDNPLRALSSSDVEYTSKAKQRADREYAKQNPTKFIGASRKRNQPTIAQACVCSDKKANKVKRPKNAFILYRSANSDRILRQSQDKNCQTVSKIAAQMWKNESQEVKDRFYQLQAEEAARHKELHPDYHYEPGLQHRHRFGSASCTCGAYQANMRANADDEMDDGTEADESTAEDPYAIFSQPTGFTPPLARMSTFPDPANLGFQPYQQTGAEGYGNNAKRQRDDTADLMTDAPISKRLRSSRAPTVSYVESDDFDIFGTGIAGPSLRTKRRPSPIATGYQPISAALETTPPPGPFHIHDSPSRNTRSKSQISTALEDQLQQSAGIDYNAFVDFNADGDEGIDWDLFNGNLNWNVDGGPLLRSGSNASRKSVSRSPKNKGKKTPSPANSYSLRSRQNS